ncbi:MAG: hypothetical protein IJL98_10335 [Lachnospiraceae bacterium]|nr:hypothetical protein [Lachnospiraceae bacterium]
MNRFIRTVSALLLVLSLAVQGPARAFAQAAAARDFEDDARLVLQNWDAFREVLLTADEALDAFDTMELPDREELQKKADEALAGSELDKQIEVYADMLAADAEKAEAIGKAAGFTLAGYLANNDYEDGTLYDFFTKSSTEIEEDLSVLYPLIASLSEGQRAGLEFLSLRELVMAGNVITWGVQKASLDTAKLERAFKILRNLKAEKSMVTEQQACVEQLFQSDLNTYTEISKFYSQKIDLIKTKNELVRNIDKQETVIKNMTATGNTAQWMSVGFAASSGLPFMSAGTAR